MKNISLDLPLQKLIAVTGVSGAGKSSLVFDTIYREGRRRYLEFISTQFREFIEIQSRPEVDSIEGLPPVFFIGSSRSRNLSRATAATMTEIQDFLRILFSRAGEMHCHQCGQILKKYTAHEIVDEIIKSFSSLVCILAPLPAKTSLSWLKKEGFIRVKTKDGIVDISKIKEEDAVQGVVIDRLEVKSSERLRISESIDLALRYGAGAAAVSETGAKADHWFFTDYRCRECGLVFGEMSTGAFSFNSPYGACKKCGGLGKNDDLTDCPDCKGSRLSPAALSCYAGGLNLADLGRMEIKDLPEYFQKLSFPDEKREGVKKQIWQNIQPRIRRLNDFGIGYLKLNQGADCLSEGELQRLKLASHMASGLVGVLYILDEPTAGLHPADMNRLIELMKELRDQGNTLIVVEHEQKIMEAADWIVELGPEAGKRGGELIAAGPLEKIKHAEESVTGRILRGDFFKRESQQKRKIPDDFIEIRGACANNLKNIDVNIPLNALCSVTGVSGSGKSSLIVDVLYRASQDIHAKRRKNSCFKEIKGFEKVRQWILADSQIIGKSSRSILATYSGVFDLVRNLFAQVPESRVRGYRVNRFSFNEKSGRCEACEGQGIQYVDLVYLPDLEIVCEICKGSRFNRETLEVKYKGKNIAEVLALTVDEAKEFFRSIPAVFHRLECLQEIGLGYLALGQGLTTLSNGEAQRMKLASELFGRSKGGAVYILEEPSKGLHALDIQRLLKVLIKLRDQGNTVIVIEHDLNIIFHSDYVIDMGPGPGFEGGRIIAAGTPEEIIKTPDSKTGLYLRALWE